MGAEKTASMKSSHRVKPPPVPPRPQHLIPVKMMAKYSSMPDILNGWRRDTNPDLVKLGNAGVYSKRSIVDAIRPDCVKMKMKGDGVVYPPMLATSNEYLAEKSMLASNYYRDVKSNGNNYTMLPIRGRANVVEPDRGNKTYKNGGGNNSDSSNMPVTEKSSKKFSCIPSRNNSKKKQMQQHQQKSTTLKMQNKEHIEGNNYRCGKNNGNGSCQISRTSWYVEDIQLSKCEINVNTPDTSATTSPNHGGKCAGASPSTTVVNVSPYDNNFCNVSQRTYHRKRYQQTSQQQSPLPETQRTMLSSPSLSSLPPLPKSLSDASLLWETTSKCVIIICARLPTELCIVVRSLTSFPRFIFQGRSCFSETRFMGFWLGTRGSREIWLVNWNIVINAVFVRVRG